MPDQPRTDIPRDTEDFLRAVNAQRVSADPTHQAFVMANAGSGKTKVLIDRVARLLLRRGDGRPGARPDSILCITYTKAAANEMLSRLFRTLGEWSVMKDDKLRMTLSRLEGRSETDYSSDDLRAARALFARALETPGGLRIETIHAFCARILRRFPLEAGVLPGFREIEEDEARAIWQKARADAVLRAQRDCPERLSVLALEGGHEGASAALDAMRMKASAFLDFGEQNAFDTARMREMLLDLLNAPEAAPADMLASAMTDEMPVAALREALTSLRASGKRDDQRTANAVEAALAESDPAKRWEAYRGAFFGAKDAYKRLYNAEAGKDANVVSLFSTTDPLGTEVRRVQQLADALKLAETVERTTALLEVGLPALRAYQAAKEARGALDFDDLIRKTRDLLTRRGMSDWVLYKLDGGISHVLLDEAQDTSPEQWELISALTEEFFAGLGAERQQDPRTLFVVGDEKQSIYSFQGAEPAKFRQKEQDYTSKDPNLRTENMEMSFRSSPEVLSFVDAVWNSAAPIDVAADSHPPFMADKVKHRARRADQSGLVELWPIPPKDEEEESDAWALPPVNAMRASSPKARLAQQVAASVREMIARGESVWEEQPNGAWVQRPMRPEDVLILVRGRTGGLFDAIISALKARGLPVAGADRLKLGEHIGVQDCLNLMRFALLPERDLTLAEILRGPFVGLVDDDRYLYPLASGRGRGETLWSRVLESEDPDVGRARDFLQGLVARRDLPPYEFLSFVLDQPDSDGVTGWERINARLGTPAHDPIEALVARAQAYDSAEPSALEAFVSEIETNVVEIKRDLAAPEGKVRVMTVHGAKGLQAPVVILPDTTAGPKPVSDSIFEVGDLPVWSPRKDADIPGTSLARAIANAKAEEEFRRLLYVALTRAQDRLIIAGHWHGASSGEGYHARSWYALCRQGMSELGVEEDEAGVFRLGKPVPAFGRSRETAPTQSELPGWVKRSPPEEAEGRRFTAPTRILGPDTPVSAPFGTDRQARMRRGRIIHALLEYLPELDVADRAQAADAYLEELGDLSAAERSEMKSAVFGVLEDERLAMLFAPGARAEAAIVGTDPERLPRGMVVNGRVDRLVVTDSEVLIVDFKTDQPAPDSPDKVAETYRAQMAAYWAVLRKAYPGRTVKAALCWTDGPRLMILPEEMLLEALNSAQRVI